MRNPQILVLFALLALLSVQLFRRWRGAVSPRGQRTAARGRHNLGLFALIVFSGGQLYLAQRDLVPLRAELARISAKRDTLELQDPRNYHAASLETGDPMAFAWRMYQPPGIDLVGRTEWGPLGTSTHPLREIVRDGQRTHRIAFESTAAGIRYFENGRLDGFSGIRWNQELGEFLAEHWNELRFSAFGERGVVVERPPDATLTLLTIEIPPEFEADLTAAVGEDRAKELMSGPIFQLTFGAKRMLTKTAP